MNVLEGCRHDDAMEYLGQRQQDFTDIDDIVDGILRVLNQLPQGDPAVDSAAAPYRIFNIGNNRPVSLLNFIETLEAALGIEAPKTFLPNCHTTPSWS